MPQVLFSGAILAVPSMNIVGEFLSALMITRWSFEALGRSADLNNLFANGVSAHCRRHSPGIRRHLLA